MDVRRCIDTDSEKLQDFDAEQMFEDTTIKREDIQAEEVEAVLATDSDTLKATQILQCYEEQQADLDLYFRRNLRARKKLYLLRKFKSLARRSLNNWLNNNN